MAKVAGRALPLLFAGGSLADGLRWLKLRAHGAIVAAYGMPPRDAIVSPIDCGRRRTGRRAWMLPWPIFVVGPSFLIMAPVFMTAARVACRRDVRRIVLVQSFWRGRVLRRKYLRYRRMKALYKGEACRRRRGRRSEEAKAPSSCWNPAHLVAGILARCEGDERDASAAVPRPEKTWREPAPAQQERRGEHLRPQFTPPVALNSSILSEEGVEVSERSFEDRARSEATPRKGNLGPLVSWSGRAASRPRAGAAAGVAEEDGAWGFGDAFSGLAARRHFVDTGTGGAEATGVPMW